MKTLGRFIRKCENKHCKTPESRVTMEGKMARMLFILCESLNDSLFWRYSPTTKIEKIKNAFDICEQIMKE